MNKKQVVIKTNRKKFFRHWMTLTKPFHKLRPKEQDVLALFIYYYYEYKTKINDEKLIWRMVFDYDTKILIKEELGGMKDNIFQNLVSALRKSEAIVVDEYEHIKPSFIPKIDYTANKFDLIFTMLIDESTN